MNRNKRAKEEGRSASCAVWRIKSNLCDFFLNLILEILESCWKFVNQSAFLCWIKSNFQITKVICFLVVNNKSVFKKPRNLIDKNGSRYREKSEKPTSTKDQERWIFSFKIFSKFSTFYGNSIKKKCRIIKVSEK